MVFNIVCACVHACVSTCVCLSFTSRRDNDDYCRVTIEVVAEVVDYLITPDRGVVCFSVLCS